MIGLRERQEFYHEIFRIAERAVVGFLVASGWAVYAWASTPPAMTFGDPLMPLVQLTCPIAFASFHFHFGVSLSGVWWQMPQRMRSRV